MINLKEILKKEASKRLVSNFISLSILQAVNYILPLVTLPYLIRVIGMDNVGLLAFATATITYFQIFTDYGFNLTATKEVSIHRNDKEKICEIFNAVILIKIALTLISFIVLCTILFTVQRFWKNYDIYILTFGTIIGQALFPVWFFQGIEKMKYITYLNVLAKGMFTIAIFIFIREKKDFYLVPLLTSGGFIIAGICSLIIVKKKFKVEFKIPSAKALRYHFTEGWDIFISNFFSAFYRNTNVIILGFITNNTLVGYYSIAEKIIRSLQSLQNVMGNTLFPFITKRFHSKKTDFFLFLERYSKYVYGAYTAYAVLIFLFSKMIVWVLTKENNLNVLVNLRILSFVLFFGGINYFFGILGLVPLNYKKEFSRYVLMTGIFSIISCFILVYFYEDIGASLAWIFSEIFLLILIKMKINDIKRKI